VQIPADRPDLNRSKAAPLKTLTLSALAIAMNLGLATASPSASAKDRYPELMTSAPANKDGMVSKEEFVAAMA
jgi:hypothetical protein